MQSSLYTGISGLNANMSDLSIIGNNIANVNTVGFKSSRVTFDDVLGQSLSGGSGTNQVGLGVAMSGVQKMFTQGAFESTGNGLDMAINGNGFFIVKDLTSNANYYSRAGQFNTDKNGYLTNPDGLRLQGYVANASGTLQNTVQDLNLSTKTIPPNQTTKATLNANLNSNSPITGYVFTAGTNDGLSFTINGKSYTSGLVANGGLTSGSANTGGVAAAAIKTALEAAAVTVPATAGNKYNVAYNDQTGLFTITNNAGNVGDLSMNWGSSSAATLLGFSGAGTVTIVPPTLACTTGVNDTVNITLNGTPYAVSLTNPALGASALTSGATVTGAALAAALQAGINNKTTAVNPLDTYTVAYNAGTNNFTISDLNTTPHTLVVNWSTSNAAPLFDQYADMTFPLLTATSTPTTVQPLPTVNAQTSTAAGGAFVLAQAGNTSDFSTPMTVYDSLGNNHVATMYFRKATSGSSGNVWNWYAVVNGTDTQSGNTENPASGSVTFNTNGALLTSFTNASTGFNFKGGAAQGQQITFNFGTSIAQGGTGIDGTTQFATSSGVSTLTQDGYASGTLQRINVGQDGLISGVFTNGQNLTLGQVLFAAFASPVSLSSNGKNTYKETLDSGQPLIGPPGTSGRGLLQSSTLELSNVDMAQEFVNMITAQRGFQANSKIITTTDQMLQELVNLKQ